MSKIVDHHIEETPTEARQGTNVRWQMRVFVISMAAAVITLTAYFFVFAKP
jgi:hypothetical protein